MPALLVQGWQAAVVNVALSAKSATAALISPRLRAAISEFNNASGSAAAGAGGVAAGTGVEVALAVEDAVGVVVAENADGATRTESKHTPVTRLNATIASDRERRI